MLVQVLCANLPYKYMSAKWLKSKGYTIKLLTGGFLGVYLAVMLLLTPVNCTVYARGHMAYVNTYTANVQIYQAGTLIRMIASPGQYVIGKAIGSYSCR